MNKIGIINCYKMSKTCSGINCFSSMKAKIDSFETYSRGGFELVAFGHCNECCKTSPSDIAVRGESMKKAGVDTIHVSSCIKLKCPNYNEFIKILSNDFKIVPFTHAIK